MSRYTIQSLCGFAVEIAGLIIMGTQKLWTYPSEAGIALSVIGLVIVLKAKKPIPDTIKA